MKKTWKRWLGTVAAALVTSTALAQSPNGAGVATTRGQSPQYSEEGLIRMGHPSASATGRGVRQTQYEPAINPEAVFEDYRSGGGYAPQGQGGAPPQVGGDYPTQNDGGYYNERQVPGFAPLRSINDVQWRVGYQGLDTLGYKGETTNLNAFVPLMSDDSQNLLFFVPRVNFFSSGNANTGDVGGNLGLGLRHFDPANHRIYGISGWWDYDPGHQRIYNQAGLSLESLGKYSSLRFNANVPLEKSTDITSAASLGSPFFQGNNIAYFYNFQRESSYQNYQLEIASPIPLLGRYGAEWAVSGYGLVANAKGAPNSAGIAGRLELQVSEDLWINATVSNDKIYGTNTGINFELTLPNGPQTRWLRLNRSRDKMLSTVKRTYRVSTAINAVQETQFFLNSKNGAAIQVAHIDPEAASVGTGAVLNPFGSVADYMANAGRAGFDIIYVGRNADGSDTDLNTGIEVLGCQRLLGTGTLADGSVHQFVTLDRGDGGVLFNLPGFGNSNLQSTGANPFMTNSAAPVGTPVVSINGNITEVTGFQFDASGTANVIQSAIPVDGFAITNNTFQNAIDAINIVSDTSPVLGITTTLPPSRSPGENYGIVTNNTIDGALGTPGGMVNGIVIDHVGGTGAEALHLRVTDNTLSTLTGTGIDVTAEAGTQIVANATSFGFQDNTITSAGQGILARSTGAGAIFDLTVQNNTITNSTDVVDPLNPELGAGMGFLADNGGAFNFNLVTNNRVTNVLGGGGRGGAFVAESGGTMTFTPDVVGDPVFFANTFTGNGDDGLLFEATGAGSAITLQEVLNNTFTGNGASGLDFMALAGGSVTSGPITRNTLTNNGEDGLSGTADGAGSVLNLQIGSADPLLFLNVITGNGENGIDLRSSNGATLIAPIVRNTITGNTLDGIHYVLDTTTHDTIQISQNNISDNLGGGVDIQADATAINDILIDSNAIERNLGGDGIRFLMTDSSVTNVTVESNAINANRDNGINFDLDNTPIQNINILNNSQGVGVNIGLAFQIIGDTFNLPFEVINTSDPGIQLTNFLLDIGPTATVFDTVFQPPATQLNTPFQPLVTTGQVLSSDIVTGLVTVNGTAITQGTNPLEDAGGVVLVDGGVADNSSVLDLDFNNFAPGEAFTWNVDVDPAVIPPITVLGSDLIGSNIQATFTGGLVLAGQLQAIPGNPQGSIFVATSGNTTNGGISGNGLDGILFNARNGSNIGNLTIDNNVIDANGRNGIEFQMQNSTLPTLGNPAVISNNTITGNAVDGVHIDVSQGTVMNALSFTSNTITGNTQDGVDINLTDTTVVNIDDFSGNTVSSNGAFGMRVNAADTAQFSLNMGASGALNGLNVFDNNVDAGVGITLINSSTANLTVTNSTFSNTTDSAADTLFNGEGFHVRLIDNATLPNATFGDALDPNTTFDGNVGSGLALFVDGDAQITDPLVQNILFNNNGTLEGAAFNGGLAPDDGDAGFRLIRQGSGVVDNVVIDNNVFTSNANGIVAVARAADLTDEYTITNNVITGQEFRGIAFRAEADADITALIQSNTISNNGNEGIQTTERRNNATDSLSVDLQVFDNLIQNNGQNGVAGRGQGIEISAVHNLVIIGSNANPTPDNTISGNFGDGIEINNAGFAVIENNLIQNNGGEAGIDLNAVSNTVLIDNNQILDNLADGIELSSLGAFTAMDVTVSNNLIRGNGQDGLEIISNSANSNSVNAFSNVLADNLGRGIAIFNRGNGSLTTNLSVDLTDNIIFRNGEEGVYVVNTSSITQSTDVASTVVMDATGSVFADPRLIFNMTNNTLAENGVLSGFPGTGLVVRVGTSDASISFTDPGGFAATRGGIVASVIGNSFGGHFGSDVYFESFVSTVNPATTGGAWTDQNENPRNFANDVFSPSGFQSDPLARLDLTFSGNTGEDIDATNIGAFYINDESVFKSRTAAQDNGNDGGPDDNGPFGSGTRQRNAQRLAARFNLPPQLVIGASNSFLYSGIGESTFRVSSTGNVFTAITSPFILDDVPYINQNSANGLINGFGGPFGIDFMPYGWSTLP